MIIIKVVSSLKKNKTGIFLMMGSSFFVCFGQLLWKLSHTNGFFYLMMGFVFYSIGALVMIVSYKFGSLSILQPVLSLNYVLAIIFAHFVLNEVISINKLIGIFIIIFGIFLICIGDE